MKSPPSARELLATHRLFAAMPTAELEALANKAEVLALGAGQPIAPVAGQPVWAVARGAVRAGRRLVQAGQVLRARAEAFALTPTWLVQLSDAAAAVALPPVRRRSVRLPRFLWRDAWLLDAAQALLQAMPWALVAPGIDYGLLGGDLALGHVAAGAGAFCLVAYGLIGVVAAPVHAVLATASKPSAAPGRPKPWARAAHLLFAGARWPLPGRTLARRRLQQRRALGLAAGAHGGALCVVAPHFAPQVFGVAALFLGIAAIAGRRAAEARRQAQRRVVQTAAFATAYGRAPANLLADAAVARGRLGRQRARRAALARLARRAQLIATLCLAVAPVLAHTLRIGQALACCALADGLVTALWRWPVPRRTQRRHRARPSTLGDGRLRLQGLHVGRLRNVTLVMAPGERVAVHGDSGCGKSTLANVVGGTRRPVRGIRRGGAPQVAVVPRQPAWQPSSVQHNVTRGRPVSAAELAWVARATGLAPDGWQATEHPSTQLRLQVGVARALLQHPRLLVLDDSLDTVPRAAAIALLEALHAACPDIGVLLLTCDRALARSLPRRAALRRGRLHWEAA